jgi:hypothetical protein
MQRACIHAENIVGELSAQDGVASAKRRKVRVGLDIMVFAFVFSVRRSVLRV